MIYVTPLLGPQCCFPLLEWLLKYLFYTLPRNMFISYDLIAYDMMQNPKLKKLFALCLKVLIVKLYCWKRRSRMAGWMGEEEAKGRLLSSLSNCFNPPTLPFKVSFPVERVEITLMIITSTSRWLCEMRTRLLILSLC